MGYTVTILPKTPAAAEKMLAFARANFRTYDEITDKQFNPGYWGPQPANKLSYCDRPGHIGFDYASGCAAREWVYMMVFWMAGKVGKRSSKGALRYLYDGDTWVNISDDEIAALSQPRKRFWNVFRSGERKALQREIVRLNKLWDGGEWDNK